MKLSWLQLNSPISKIYIKISSGHDKKRDFMTKNFLMGDSYVFLFHNHFKNANLSNSIDLVFTGEF